MPSTTTNANAPPRWPPPPMPSNNRYWHKAWTVDLENRTASHEIGLVVRFEKDGDTWDGSVTEESNKIAFNAAMTDRTMTEATQYLARLMREAGDAFVYALEKARYDASTDPKKRAQSPLKPRKPN